MEYHFHQQTEKWYLNHQMDPGTKIAMEIIDNSDQIGMAFQLYIIPTLEVESGGVLSRLT